MATSMARSATDTPSLLRESAYVAGRWVVPGDNAIVVTNPSDGSCLGRVPKLTEKDVIDAIEGAAAAWEGWRATPLPERTEMLHSWGKHIRDNRETLALLVSLEQGKPVAEARSEIDYAESFVHWFAEEARRQYGDVIPSHLEGSRMIAVREPIGVAACITPWNFPSAMVTRKAAAALGAGCPVIVVPSVQAPFSALALAKLAERAGIPGSLFSVLTGDPETIVPPLCRSDTVRALSFTGSTAIGRLLMRESACTIKRLSLELGGHAPFIVFEDADIDAAVSGCIAAKFTTSGQDCLAANRIFVHDDVYEKFASRFVAAAAQLKVGSGLAEGVDLGPLMHADAVEKCDVHVRDAVDLGAALLLEGGRQSQDSLFYDPVVLGQVDARMRIYREETFGPVAPLIRFADDMGVISAANDTIYGLAAYVYSNDAERAWRAAEMLEYGMVAINTAKMTGAQIPFGGYKRSGLGREGSRYGLDEYSELKYICWGGHEYACAAG